MDETIKRQILGILDGHRDMSLATVRPDGWPQATTVGYANEGMTLYFLCGLDSQKAHNLAHDARVSLTIDDKGGEVMQITGLSMAARADRITDPAEGARVIDLLMARYPEQKALNLPPPKPQDVALYKLTPVVISVIDYSKGFAHTDLVSC
jgi:nitroimidazol reductase NimA-like FMN-containing flavoprotein (pyridoxamine 5'-phosphate oxidase superfamily)